MSAVEAGGSAGDSGQGEPAKPKDSELIDSALLLENLEANATRLHSRFNW